MKTINHTLTEAEFLLLKNLLNKPAPDADLSTIAGVSVLQLLVACVRDYSNNTELPSKPHIPYSLSAFRAGISHLPPEAAVCLDDGSPVGWTYSARDNTIYIHKS